VTRSSPPRIVISGAGVAGSLIAAGLSGRDDVEVICLERARLTDHLDAGTGLNMGPNALKTLASVMPERGETIAANSLPWQRWLVALTSGHVLMDLPLADVADNPGIRIRWAELYALLRKPLAPHIVYGIDVRGCGRDESGVVVRYTDAHGSPRSITDVDLFVAGDGRYSQVRRQFLGDDPPTLLGVCLYRILFPVDDDCPVDDYGQWFQGPNRLLAFRVPGNFVYCAGSFPITDGVVTDAMKEAAALAARYVPGDCAPSREAQFLIDAIIRHVDDIHWARLQEGPVKYMAADGVLLVGDAAHPMVPTLGQGATQAVEDACVVVDEVRRSLSDGGALGDVPRRVEERRRERVQFVVDFSRDATDTMLAGADPVAGTLRKLEPPFVRNLTRLYRDVPMAEA
jgi:2-polyprenyl-6-methoxyphenol hydroxylase-like FAD-dependent oxidoreductase